MKNQILKGILLFVLIVWSITAQSQTNKVTGLVVDQQQEALIGITIIVKNSSTGTITNTEGKFEIQAEENSTLIFTAIGYKSQEYKVGTTNNIKIILEEDVLAIDEVVVTALGIQRSEKSLGYSVSKFDTDELTNAYANNWLSAMSGKVAGLNLDEAGAGPGGTVRVTLRGESSLDPSKSSALIIIDGQPINNSLIGSSSSSAYNATNVDMPVDYGTAVGDINPEDVANVTVLKGAAATALYGSQAANGAIIITTKSGTSQKGFGVTVSSTLSFEDAGYWPDFQYEYGSGALNSLSQEQTYSFYTNKDLGINRSSHNLAWGPRFEGQMFYQYGAMQDDASFVATPWEAKQNWYTGLFETGTTLNNYVAIQGSNGRGTSGRVSFTDRRNSWITPNTGYNSQNLNLTFNTTLHRSIKLDVRLNYNGKKTDNLPMSGIGRSTIPYALIWSTPSIDINWYKDYKQMVEDYPGQGRNSVFYSLTDGPYFQAYEQLNSLNRDRIYGTTNLHIDINKNLNIQLRSGMDMSNDFRTQRKPYNSVAYMNGRYREYSIADTQFNNDLLINYKNKFGDFSIQSMLGGSIFTHKSNRISTVAVSLEVPDQYTLSNSVSQLLINPYRTQKQINSLYGTAEISYKDFIYMNITGRNDWSSTLQKGNNSYFYPSVSSSLLLSEIFKLSRDVDLLKLRVSWANVGNDTDPYNIHNVYQNSDFSGGIRLPISYSNTDIKPEMVESWEFGLDGRFLKGRIGFDVVYYHASSYNQIMHSPIDPSTGYYESIFNAGKITNQGLEVNINGQVIKTKKFRWNTSLVYAKNVNKVVELTEGIDAWVISAIGRAQVEARPGGTLGAIYGTGFERVPEGTFITLEDGSQKNISGEIVYDAATGYPIQNTSELRYMGDTQPNWKGGITNSFSYNGFKLNILVDGQFGGKAYSMTHSMLSYTGKLTNSLPGRYDGLVGEGYCYDPTNDTYVKNTTVTESISYYYDRYYNRDNIETNIFSTSFIKLRELRLQYDLSKKTLSNLKGIQGVSIALFGRNLAMWTKWPIFDPEVANLSGSDIMVGFESGAFPMTRTYGFNLKLKF